MSGLPEAAGIPVTIKVGEITYTLSPMTLGDWAILERWAEDAYFADMQKRLQIVNDAEISKLIKQRLLTISKAELKYEAAGYMNSAQGSIKALQLQLLHNHKDMTEETAKDLLTYVEANALTARLSAVEEKDKLATLEHEFCSVKLPNWLDRIDEGMPADDLIQGLRRFINQHKGVADNNIRPTGD